MQLCLLPVIVNNQTLYIDGGELRYIDGNDAITVETGLRPCCSAVITFAKSGMLSSVQLTTSSPLISPNHGRTMTQIYSPPLKSRTMNLIPTLIHRQ